MSLNPHPPAAFRTLRLLALVFAVSLLFESVGVATGWHFLARMLSPHAWTLPHLWLVQAVSTGIRGVTSWREFAFPDMRVLLVLIPALLLDWKQYRRKSETFFMDWPAWAKGLFLALVVLAIRLLSFGETSAPFVYQGF